MGKFSERYVSYLNPHRHRISWLPIKICRLFLAFNHLNHSYISLTFVFPLKLIDPRRILTLAQFSLYYKIRKQFVVIAVDSTAYRTELNDLISPRFAALLWYNLTSLCTSFIWYFSRYLVVIKLIKHFKRITKIELIKHTDTCLKCIPQRFHWWTKHIYVIRPLVKNF